MVNNKKSKNGMRSNNNRRRRVKALAFRSELGNQSNKLIPNGVNNRATMPPSVQRYVVEGEEVVRIVTGKENAIAGDIIANELIATNSVERLSILARTFQRVKWLKAEIHIVALNGSLATSGYNAGFVEDPEAPVPTVPSAVIPFLTSMRTTSIRQTWVETSVGHLVRLNDLPEMYTARGTDPRRLFIGRFLAAYTGAPGPNVSFQINLKYKVEFSVPIALGEIPGPEIGQYVFTADLISGAPSLLETQTELSPALLADVPASDVTCLSPLPESGTWRVKLGSSAMLLKVGPVNTTLDTENNNEWVVHNAIKDATSFEIISDLYVPPNATSWANVMYRTDTIGPFKAWPKGEWRVQRAGGTPQLASQVVITTSDVCALPDLPSNVEWANDLGIPEYFPGNWPQTPIILSGTILEKITTTQDEDLLNLFNYRFQI
jgi:hypothetical protein